MTEEIKVRNVISPKIWDIGALFTIGLTLALMTDEPAPKWWQAVLGGLAIYAFWPLFIGILVGLILKETVKIA